jgi:hypothetical protein
MSHQRLQNICITSKKSVEHAPKKLNVLYEGMSMLNVACLPSAVQADVVPVYYSLATLGLKMATHPLPPEGAALAKKAVGDLQYVRTSCRGGLSLCAKANKEHRNGCRP